MMSEPLLFKANSLNSSPQRGATFVEIVVGIAVLTLIITFTVKVSHNLQKGSVVIDSNRKAQNALRTCMENIREQSISAFDANSFTVTDANCLTEGKITVTKTISAIDPVSKVRNALLTAKWIQDGNTHTEIMNGILRQVSGIPLGGRVQINVRDAYANAPLQGVGAGAIGEDKPFVHALSDEKGLIDLKGVKIGTHINVRLHGWAIRYFFKDATDIYQSSYMKDLDVSVASYGGDTISKPSPDTYNLWPMGTLKVTAHQFGDAGIPVQEASVLIYPKNTYLKVPGMGNKDVQQEMTLKTDSNGDVFFYDLAPGFYWAYLLGNDQWASLAKPDDAIWINPTGDFEITSGETYNLTFATLKMGSLHGTIGEITNAGILSPSGTASNVDFRIRWDNKFDRGQYNASTDARVDLSKTMAWEQFRKSEPQYQDMQSDSSGFYSTSTVTPAILDITSRSTYFDDLNSHKNAVSLEFIHPVEDPYTPIVAARAEGSAAPPTWAYFYDDESVYKEGKTLSDYQSLVAVHTDSLVKRYYVAVRDGLSNLAGNLINAGDLTRFEGSAGTVSVNVGEGGQGGVVIDGANKAVLAKQFSASTVLTVGVSHTYTFDLGGAYPRRLPPNIGAETTIVTFRAQTASFSGNYSFMATLQGIRKIKVANAYTGGGDLAFAETPGDIIYQVLTKSDLQLLNISMVSDAGWTDSPDFYDTDTKIQSLSPHPVTTRSEYIGQSAPVVLPFGTELSNIDIEVNPPSNSFVSQNIKIVNNDSPKEWIDQNSQFTYQTGVPFSMAPPNMVARGDPADDNLVIWEICRAPKVYGQIINEEGVPLGGATIQLNKTKFLGQDKPNVMTYTSDDVFTTESGTGRDYNFIFTNIDFIPAAGDNLSLRITLPGNYHVEQRAIKGYQGVIWYETIGMVEPTPAQIQGGGRGL